jgi:hypothetical protein
MSDSPNSDPRRPASAEGSGVLAGLPRTRPQRTSARRAAARAAKPSSASIAPSPPTKRRRPAKSRRTSRESAPKQGFEAEPDSSGPVQPPGGAELIASAAELAGELAKTGVTTGARLVRDFLSHLPG